MTYPPVNKPGRRPANASLEERLEKAELLLIELRAVIAAQAKALEQLKCVVKLQKDFIESRFPRVP